MAHTVRPLGFSHTSVCGRKAASSAYVRGLEPIYIDPTKITNWPSHVTVVTNIIYPYIGKWMATWRHHT